MDNQPHIGLPRTWQGATPARGQAKVTDPDVTGLLRRTARGDEAAFAQLYDRIAARVYGLVLRVVRDPAQAEEVAQEVLVQVWRSATRFDPGRGSGIAWILALAHRRAVDRVRSSYASQQREHRAAAAAGQVPHDEVSEQVVGRLEQQAVRHCLNALTDVQREAIDLAYYRGYTYRQTALVLSVALPTVKTRIRDGLIRLRDCLGANR
ncbi:MAG TPA: ECF RNA polymerase sigma factor SigK [Micromonosporaceae bacterium]|nr:ECF RNA polymerase sigma factor SigK [Micromonosporaceae bacterium]